MAIEFEWARTWARKVMGWLRYLSSPKNVRRILFENSLSLVLFLFFFICLLGQLISGQRSYNSERRDHGKSEVSFKKYAFSGHSIEATFENWESEFLQMGALVILTVYFRQKGAADSHKLRGGKDQKGLGSRAGAPWPVRKGGWVLRLYEHSLSLSLLLLFVLSFALHAAGGARKYNEALADHGQAAVSAWHYMGTSQFWFECFQNWQSEFLSVAVLLVLSIFMRERGSPQSKHVAATYSDTGSD